jgi:hypothetical protein
MSAGGSGGAQDPFDLFIPFPDCPSERSSPWLIVRQIRWRATGKKKSNHSRIVISRSEREWSRAELIFSGRNCRACVEQHGGTLRILRYCIAERIRRTEQVKHGLHLPVTGIRMHAVIEERPQHVGLLE